MSGNSSIDLNLKLNVALKVSVRDIYNSHQLFTFWYTFYNNKFKGQLLALNIVLS